MNTLPLRPPALIVALALALLVTASPRAQAQTIPTTGQNATTNSQLTTANTANALGTSTGTTTDAIAPSWRTAAFGPRRPKEDQIAEISCVKILVLSHVTNQFEIVSAS